MIPLVPRRARKIAFVCLVALALLGSFLAGRASAARLPIATGKVLVTRDVTSRDAHVRTKYDAAPISLATDDGKHVLAFPPRAGKEHAIPVVYLHGIHGRAENGCPWLRGGTSELGWLVCPEANEHLPNDTYSWTGTAKDQYAIVARAERATGVDTSTPDVVVGFSQGAFVALDLVHAKLGRHAGLVLISADVAPNANELRDAGVKRVAFAAGELDATYAPLQKVAERLAREGIETRFTSLGRVGHVYVPETATHASGLHDVIAWAGQG